VSSTFYCSRHAVVREWRLIVSIVMIVPLKRRETPRNAENAGLPDDVSAIALATVEVSGVSNGGRSRETLKDERLGCASATP
jgi:hypothetical protein